MMMLTLQHPHSLWLSPPALKLFLLWLWFIYLSLLVVVLVYAKLYYWCHCITPPFEFINYLYSAAWILPTVENDVGNVKDRPNRANMLRIIRNASSTFCIQFSINTFSVRTMDILSWLWLFVYVWFDSGQVILHIKNVRSWIAFTPFFPFFFPFFNKPPLLELFEE